MALKVPGQNLAQVESEQTERAALLPLDPRRRPGEHGAGRATHKEVRIVVIFATPDFGAGAGAACIDLLILLAAVWRTPLSLGVNIALGVAIAALTANRSP
jgi:hypothetical protein